MMAILWLGGVSLACMFTYRKAAGTHRGRFGPRRFWFDRYAYAVASAWLQWIGAYPILLLRLPQLVRYCTVLYGKADDVPDPAYAWAVKAFALSMASLIGTVFALLANADVSILLLLAGLVFALPVVLWQELGSKIKKRHEAFITELPTFMHKLSLLIAAGETVRRAWIRAGIADADRGKHPLYEELMKTSNELSQGIPFSKALEDLHRRCGIHEMSTLATTVLMNYRRGGEMFALALQDASRLMMERKYAVVRTRGEEASTKLLLPMMFMLFAVMTIVAAPAVMMMK